MSSRTTTMGSMPTTHQDLSASARLVQFLQRTSVHAVIVLLCLIWSVPTIGLLVSSFRPASLVATTGWWTAFRTPLHFTLDLYHQALGTAGMGQSFVNSLFISIPATVIPIMIAAFAAFAFAWMDFPGRDLLFIIVVGLLVVPLQMTLIPILKIYSRLGLTGTFLGIWLAHTGYGLPFAVYLLRNFFGTLPRDILESAYLDGASPFTAFFRLVLPLSVPAIASLAIFQFMWVWNDLLVALIYLGGYPSVAPMTVTISNLVNSLGGGWQLLTAAAFISMMLPLLVFFTLQRYFVRGILAGSIKG
jgi:alpha-glucoside transport system permease protein